MVPVPINKYENFRGQFSVLRRDQRRPDSSTSSAVFKRSTARDIKGKDAKNIKHLTNVKTSSIISIVMIQCRITLMRKTPASLKIALQNAALLCNYGHSH
jgi:hypothetical protein